MVREWYTGVPQMVIQALFLMFGLLGAFAIGHKGDNPHSKLRRKYFLQLMGVSGGALCLLFVDPSLMQNPRADLLTSLFWGLVYVAWILIVLGFSGTSVLLSGLGCLSMFRESRWKPVQAPVETSDQSE